MGTSLYDGGVTFRVWAPFALSVFAVGTFNEWSEMANPFASEGNGYWSVDVPGAKIGDEYQFVIHNGNQRLWHKNPYASEVVNSSGNAIMDVVYNPFGASDLDLWRFDGWSDWNHNGGIYFYDNDRAHTPWGDTRPDYGRPEVRQYIRDNALFWLNKYRIDGLRFDSVSNIRSVNGRDLPDGWSLLQLINNEIRSTQSWAI